MSIVNKVADLNVSGKSDGYFAALEQAESVLNSEPGNTEARQAKLSALIDLDRFKDVLKFADKKRSNELPFYAYALYRLENLDELRSTASGSDVPVAATLALAQAEYKYGSLTSARELLTGLRSQLSSEGDLADLCVNLSAIDAIEGADNVEATSPESFDEFFNLARYYLGRGQPRQALEVLKQAEPFAIDDEDRQSAASQSVYALLALEDIDTALELSEKQLKHLRMGELAQSLRLIVENNHLVAQTRKSKVTEDSDKTATGPEYVQLEEPHVALKAYDGTNSSSFKFLNSGERQVLLRNKLKLQAKVHKKHVLRDAKEHLSMYPSDWEPLMVAMHYNCNNQISTFSQRPMGLLSKAAEWVRSSRLNPTQSGIPMETQLSPGNVGNLLVAIQKLQRAQVFDKLSPADLADLQVYFSKFSDGQIKRAGLHLINPDSADVASLESSIDSLTSDINIDELEQFSEQKPEKPEPRNFSIKRHKRKLPHGADPNSQPDPERWLAKQDRSGYKEKSRKTQATQGGSAVATAEVSAPKTSGEVVGAKSKKTKTKGKRRS